MADPFEVRMKFTSQLQHLNASVNSAQKAAHFAIKYKEMDEDLHSCILEQLEKNSMNNRANIMYFVEHLCDMAKREGHSDFVKMIQRDIWRIIDAVAPGGRSGTANVKVVKKVLNGLEQNQILSPQTVIELQDCLKERDNAAEHFAFSPMAVDDTTPTKALSPGGSKSNPTERPEKRQIEQRIEEDRERHKKLRESIWAVTSDSRLECDSMYDEMSEMPDDDLEETEEDISEKKNSLMERKRDVVQTTKL